MRGLRFGLLAALILLGSGGEAAAQTYDDTAVCAPYAHIDVQVIPVFDEPVFDANTPLAALQGLAGQAKAAIPHHESVMLGVTLYEPAIEFQFPVVRTQRPDRQYCTRVRNLVARVGYRNVSVKVAKEFPVGSCAFQHVMIHEKKHIAVNQRLLEDFVPVMRERLEAHLERYGMFVGPDPEFGQKILREKIDAVLNDLAEAMQAENERRQKKVDTPEEYATNQTACGGDINRATIRFLRGGR